MFVGGIYITDNIYNKQINNAIIFLIALGLVLTYAYKKISLCKDTKSKKYNCIYMYIGVLFFIIGICTTFGANKSLIENKYDNKDFNLQGVIYAISEKANSYAITITDISDLNISTDVINIYNKDEQKIKKLMVYVEKNRFDRLDVNIGNCVFVQGTLSSFVLPGNPGQFNEYDYYVKQQGYSYKAYVDHIENNGYVVNKKFKALYYKIKRSLYKFRLILSKQYYKIFDKSKAAIITGMILGDKSLIDEDTKELYQKMGISHILAISGLHISLLGMIFYKILSKIKIHTYIANVLTIVFLICYGIMTDFSISTNRAVVMMSIMLIGKICGRTYDVYTAISLSLILILIQNPLRIYDVGMQFSYTSILGIVIVYPVLKKIFDKQQRVIKAEDGLYIQKDSGEYKDKGFIHDIRDVGRKVVYQCFDKILAGFSIYLVNLPIVINSYYEMSIYAIVINIIVLYFVELLMSMSVLSVISSFISLKVGKILGTVVTVILNIYEFIGQIVSKIDSNTLIIGKKDTITIVFYYIVIISTVYLIQKNKKYIYVLLLCILIVFKIKDDNLNITMLDVSQGDGICIETINEKVITVDCGSTDVDNLDKYRLVPFLKSRGISKIDYAIISHVDSDHTSGIKGIMMKTSYGIKIKNIVLPLVKAKSQNYKDIENLANKNNVRILYVKVGDTISIDNVKFTCLHPLEEYESVDENGYSSVLLMRYKKFHMLYTGDIGSKEEELVLKSMQKIEREKISIDILKVAHHGSKNSSCLEFIKTIAPKYALISAGENNMYGHPHKETIQRFVNENIKVYCTKENGAIEIKTDGDSFGIR